MNYSSGSSNNIFLSKASTKQYLDIETVSTESQSNLIDPEEAPSKILEETGLENSSMDLNDFTPEFPETDYDGPFESINLRNYSDQQEVETMTLDYEQVESMEVADSNICPTEPIWTYNPETVTQNQYWTLYKYLTKSEDNDKPLAYDHLQIDEEDLKLQVILYVPSKPLLTLSRNSERVICCFKDSIISGTQVDLLPPYLSFICGVVESDLHTCFQPLNYEGEKLLGRVKKHLVEKSLKLIKRISEDKAEFEEFYNRFSSYLKNGVREENNYENRKILSTFLRYFTSVGHEICTFHEYRTRMSNDQEGIYYFIGESLQVVSDSIFVKRAAKKGLEVVYMTNSEDDQIVQKLKHFDGYRFIAVEDAEFSQDTTEEDDDEESESVEGHISDNHNQDSFCSDSNNSEDVDEFCSGVVAKNKIKNEQKRKQPTRQARPKNLRDSISIVGKATASKVNSIGTKRKSTEKKANSSPRAKSRTSVRKGRRGRKPQPMIQYKGRMLNMQEFNKLPTSERFEIEEVDNPFFDSPGGELYFHVKWKFYPEEHKEKYNQERAENIPNFKGGVDAVDTFLKQFKVDSEDKYFYEKVQKEWDTLKENEKSEAILPSEDDTQDESSDENQDHYHQSPQKTPTKPEQSKSKLKSPDELEDSHATESISKRSSERSTSETETQLNIRNPMKIKIKVSSKQPSVDLEKPTEHSKVVTSSHSIKTTETAEDNDSQLHLEEVNSSSEEFLESPKPKKVVNVLDENEGDDNSKANKDIVENPIAHINTDAVDTPKIINTEPQLQLIIQNGDESRKSTTSQPVQNASIVCEIPVNATTSEGLTSIPRGRNYWKHKSYEQKKRETLSTEEYQVYKKNKRKKMRTRQKIKKQQKQELIKAVRVHLLEAIRNLTPNL